jgi:hypothetical protein
MKTTLYFSIIGVLMLLSPVKSQNSLTPIDSALVACYPFSGNANDLSGNGYNGVVQGAALTADRFGNPNSAYYFAGNTTTTNILIPGFGAALSGAGVSISFWANKTSYETRAAFLMTADNASNRLCACVYYGNMVSNAQVFWDCGDIFNNGRQFYNGCPLPAAGVWDHWVMVTAVPGNGNFMKVYKNGVLQNTKLSSSTFVASATRSLSIGGGFDVSNGNLWFEGKLDDIRIYKRALTQNDVTFLFNTNFSCSYAAMPPVTTVSVNSTNYCANTNIQCYSNSTNGATSWSWSVSPVATIITSTVQNPAINFPSSGVYTISVQASNAYGPGNVATQTVFINPTPVMTVSPASQTVCFGTTASATASGASNYTWSSAGGNNANVTYTSAGPANYTVTGAIGSCTASGNMAVTTLSVPTVIAMSSTGTACFGNSFTLSAGGTGAQSYTWVPGNATTSLVIVTPTATTIYTLTGMSANSCMKTNTVQLNILPLPTATISVSASSICLGQVVTLTAQGPTSYTWLPSGVQNSSLNVAPGAPTVYTLSFVGGNGCSNTSTVSVYVSDCTGITEFNGNSSDFNLYPNPAVSYVTIEMLVSNSNKATLEVFDSRGALVQRQELDLTNARKYNLNISSLSNGLYYVKVSLNEGLPVVKKLVKD